MIMVKYCRSNWIEHGNKFSSRSTNMSYDYVIHVYIYAPFLCCFFLHISLMNAYSANFYVLIKKFGYNN